MADWRDVMEARREADDLHRAALTESRVEDHALTLSLLAIRAELRALGVVVEYAAEGVRRG